MSKPAILLDRDGTLNISRGYVNHESQFTLFPYSVEAIRLIRSQGYLAILITNQSGVGRGLYAESLVSAVHDEFTQVLTDANTKLDGIYYCPHDPSSGCSCRKPEPGMLLRAIEEHEIDPARSYMIGDTYSDMQAGINAGLKTGLVLTGFGRGNYEYQRQDWPRQPDLVAETVYELLCRIFWDRRA